MKKILHDFFSEKNDPLTTFRTIMLFGKNTSTYKFALCHSLMNQPSRSEIKFSDLSVDFIKELYRHYNINSNQWTRGTNTITKAFDEFSITNNFDKLIVNTEKHIFNYVLDAFHNIGGSSVKKDFILFEKIKGKKHSPLPITYYK
jgi:hypothetical protein